MNDVLCELLGETDCHRVGRLTDKILRKLAQGVENPPGLTSDPVTLAEHLRISESAARILHREALRHARSTRGTGR